MERLAQPVTRCMTSTFVTIAPDRTLRQAAATLTSHDIGLLLVVEDDHVVGVLSERDVVRTLAEGSDCDVVLVGDRGSGEVVTVAEESTLAEALETMLANNVRHLVAVGADGLPSGVLSVRDVMSELAVP